MKFVKMFWKEENGQDLIEYSLLLAFLCLFAVSSYSAVSGSLNTIWTNANSVAASAASLSS
jgi:Flp pilus assembly pilin Flp